MTSLLTPVIAAIGALSSGRVWAIVLGSLLAVVAVTLLIASWTKWGQTKSLTKCIALAFLAHIWLLMYAYGTRIVTPGFGGGSQGGARTEAIAFTATMLMMEEIPKPEDSFPNEAAKENDDEKESQPAPWEAPLQRQDESSKTPSDNPLRETLKLPESIAELPKVTPVLRLESQEPELPPMESLDQIAALAAPSVAQTPAPPASMPTALAPSTTDRSLAKPSAPKKRTVDQQPLPNNYQMRMSPQRQQFAIQNGGDVNTEAAVERALAWLARAQGPDGGWNAAEHGAGRDAPILASRMDIENRHNAGLKANTAMTGLALLAFLGAGHTHTDGNYQTVVANGLQYLRSQQQYSGDLAGRDQVGHEPTVRFARMYSHGMASLAVTEAYGMTGDPALLDTVKTSCKYTLGNMNSRTGGWRYEFNTDDPGDLSQFGWQAMLLSSAENHRSIVLPPESRLLMQRFLDSVSTGRFGGLAVYRPKSGQMAPPEQATPAMTAEAIASRLLLGFPIAPQAAEEGQLMLLSNLPGSSEENLYYWYYATLAMYQLQGDIENAANKNSPTELAWERWNESLKQKLCSTQISLGPQEGSWNPSCVWGRHGGRVYSTAVACMCLEVYYRYLPMYKADQFANQWQPARR